MSSNGNSTPDVLSDAPGGGLDLEQLWYVVREKAWLIALCALIGVFAGLAYIKHTPLTYYAQAVIEVDADQVKALNYAQVEETKDPLSDDMSPTILAVFKSRAFAQAVIEKYNLLKNPEFIPPNSNGQPHSMDEAIGALIGMSRVDIRPGTRFIEVGVIHSNPHMAMELANMIANGYMDQALAQREAATQEITNFLKNQENLASQQLTKDKEDEQTYVKNHMGSLVEENDTVTADLRTKSGELNTAHLNRITLEADDDQIQKHVGDEDALLAVPSVASNPTIQESLQLIKEYNEKIKQLAFWYTDRHPKMIAAKTELADEEKILSENLRKIPAVVHAQLVAAKVMEEKVQEELNAQQTLAMKLDDDHIGYDALERKVETDNALYVDILTRLKQVGVVTGMDSTGLHLFEAAQVPMEPVQARKSKTLAIAMVGGLAAGVLLAFGLHMMDSSVKTVDQAEDVLGLTVLASIPRQNQSRLRESSLALVKAPGSPVAEAFRSLRTSVYLAGKTKGRKIVLFTSTLAGEGKTFCSTNYATALAQQGLKTLLIDADLRSPMIRTVLLNNKKTLGLGEVLTKKAGLQEAIHETEIENLFVMPAGELLPNPAEMLAQSDMAGLVSQLGEQFERIVIDTAPVTAVSDTLLLLEHAQAICLVAQAGKTSRKWILRALKLIAESGSRPAGVILNQMPMKMAGAYSYYPGRYGQPEVYGKGAYSQRKKEKEEEVVEAEKRF